MVYVKRAPSLRPFQDFESTMDEDGWKSVKPFLQEHELNYPVVIANQDVANRYGGLPSLPMTLVIDRNGKIAESHAGMVDKDAFETKIKALLHAQVKIEVSDPAITLNPRRDK